MKDTHVIFIVALMSLLTLTVAAFGPEVTAWLMVAR
jgi:hypothetical protein